jgi:hypothetical protein
VSTQHFWVYTAGAIAGELRQIAADAPGDVYIVAINIWTWPSTDPRWSSLGLLWSTEQRFAKRARRARDEDPAATRWSTMHMQQRGHAIWDPEADPAGHDAMRRWAQQEDLWFAGERDEYDDALDVRAEALADRLVDGVIDIVRELHHSGEVEAIFGRAIPVALDAHDSHSPFPEWSRRANPPELYQQFGPHFEADWSPG